MKIMHRISRILRGLSMSRQRTRTREDLLRLTDRRLDDLGISRDRLQDGVAAFPWRANAPLASAPGGLPSLSDIRSKTVSGAQSGGTDVIERAAIAAERAAVRLERRRAVVALGSMSDRRLADIGIDRAHLVDEVSRRQTDRDTPAVARAA